MTRPAAILLIFISAALPAPLFAHVGFDGSSESHTGTTGATNDFSWSHTPTSGTPEGVLVFVVNRTSATHAISSVTYGGVTMAEVSGGIAKDTVFETGLVITYFLGSGIPTGANTVTVDFPSVQTDEYYAVAITVSAAANTGTVGTVLLQEDGALSEQSVNDGSPGANSMRFAALFTGHNQVTTDVSAGANSTDLQDIDLGGQGAKVVRETTAGEGARSVGFSALTADRAAVHLAVKEVPTTPTVRRKMRLFEGSKIRLVSGKVILYGQ